ncbi:MAG: hypothetical protein COT45_04330 [bacterium (Candidatus Stahlbacteria) CG08_land_8_20_14_0_20_40_26]|nr:MAG: hypothetical protein COX49_01360 [bacterium (Candidatus Stahlbacteria) CG23_combo_of_CG06-09_8_20_14_all_40_9]PIS24482.1 MAG: hypothetical protein COT45_04330 [bacterium (Candidatus Stahlbacteria) CG08_land_8_20_14_0_20_40_26]
MKAKYKKRIRLQNFNYTGNYRYFITICTHDKKVVFLNSNINDWIVFTLRTLADESRFAVWAYCIMPDHIHLLIEGQDDKSDMRKFIALFKQKTGYEYKQKYGESLWQINYYEHILRKDEDTIEIAHYIFNNPVRKGIVENQREYPYLGSFMFEV